MANTYLTQADVDNYGPELINVTQRAALQAIEPHLQSLEQQNAELRQRQAREQRRRLDSQVEAAVPNFRDFDRDPRWHQWLLGIDLMSGRVRQNLLNEAIDRGDTRRVISFFRKFEAEPASSFQSGSFTPGRAPERTPSRARSSGRQIYDNASIARLYEQRRKGLIGDDKWPAIEADLFLAQREGRVIATPFFTK